MRQASFEAEHGADWQAFEKFLDAAGPPPFPPAEMPARYRRLCQSLALAMDRHGAVWAGTNGGLARVVGDSVKSWGPADGLAGLMVFTIREAQDGSIWIGTAGNGLVRLSRRVLQNWGVAEGLSQGSVTSIAEDDSGLWVATPNKGIWRFQQGRFSRVNGPAGMSNHPYIYSIVSSDDGSVWAAGEQCLFRFHPDQKPVAYLKPPAFRTRSARARTSSGRLHFRRDTRRQF